MKHPPEIIAESQQALVKCPVELDSMLDVLAEARDALMTFYAHRSAPHLPSRLESNAPQSYWEIDRAITGIVQGVLTRGAVFQSLERILDPDYVESERAVDYVTSLVDEYPTWDGEHQFMQAVVREIDEGLRLYYASDRASQLRLLYRDINRAAKASIEIHGANEWVVFEPERVEEFDVWTVEANRLFELDVHDVRDRVRHTLRHNAETAMMIVRQFPASVLDAYESASVPHPPMSFSDIHDLFLRALPTLCLAAKVHNEKPPPIDPQFRQVFRDPPESLVCELEGNEITSFHWSSQKPHRHRNGRCPASAELPGLNEQQRRVIAAVRSCDPFSVDDPFDTKERTERMSTVEALLRVSAFFGLQTWKCQFEANKLCGLVE